MSTRVVEIRGAKFEVDMRSAVRIDTLRIGDTVSVLVKEYASYKMCHGVVVGFEPFQKLPTILVAYITSGWEAGEIKILSWNEKTSEDVELVKSVDDVLFDKADAVASLDKKIESAEAQLSEAKKKKAYFLRHFGRYWRDAEHVEGDRRAVLGEEA